MKNETANKISNTKTKISELETKIQRIQTALATGVNPYRYDESSLRKAVRDLQSAKERLNKFILKGEQESALESNKIPAVEKFLNEWHEKAKGYYFNELAQLRAFNEETQEQRSTRAGYRIYKEELKKRFSKLVLELPSYGDQWQVRLETVLAREKEAKEKMLIERVVEKVGQITDAKHLYIAENGEINGVVVGQKGKAQVETISAGGWNVQVFHFRVLVKKLD